MTHNLLPFNYEEEKKSKNFTGFAGLLIYLELMKVLKLDITISQHINIRKNKEGYGDAQVILGLMLLNLAGGESVSDIEQLEKDEGFCRILRELELKGTFGRRRKKLKKKWAKKMKNTIPSPSSIFRYLRHFHDPEEEKRREQAEGKAFIPEPNEHLGSLPIVNFELANFIQKMKRFDTATLDMDATLIEANKREALFCYKGFKSYQPFNVWWAEHKFLFYSEFRDGNVPAGFRQLEILMECLLHLPPEVKQVYIRSDSAGYQYESLKYMAEGKNERFGNDIYFAISNDMTPEFKKAVYGDQDALWNPIYKELPDGRKIKSGQEWAEICYVPNELCKKKSSADYRYIAIREELEPELFPELDGQKDLPFATIKISQKRYKLSGVVTNLDWDGEKVIHWHRKRCGKSEEVHGVMKTDLAGGRLPSGDFGANAAWWWIMILALNLQTIMKQHVLDDSWKNRRMKVVRFKIINIPGRVLYKDGWFKVRISKEHPSLGILNRAREKIMELPCLPSG